MRYKIYKLIYNGDVVYVGKTTTSLEQRKKNGYRGAYINPTLTNIYKDCDIILIEETDDATRESMWISHYSKKYNLLNIKNGDGSFNKKDYMKAYRQENKERNKEYSKIWIENNRDKVRDRDRRWRDANREKKNQYQREYIKRKKDKEQNEDKTN